MSCWLYRECFAVPMFFKPLKEVVHPESPDCFLWSAANHVIDFSGNIAGETGIGGEVLYFFIGDLQLYSIEHGLPRMT